MDQAEFLERERFHSRAAQQQWHVDDTWRAFGRRDLVASLDSHGGQHDAYSHPMSGRYKRSLPTNEKLWLIRLLRPAAAHSVHLPVDPTKAWPNRRSFSKVDGHCAIRPF